MLAQVKASQKSLKDGVEASGRVSPGYVSPYYETAGSTTLSYTSFSLIGVGQAGDRKGAPLKVFLSVTSFSLIGVGQAGDRKGAPLL